VGRVDPGGGGLPPLVELHGKTAMRKGRKIGKGYPNERTSSTRKIPLRLEEAKKKGRKT